MGGGAQRKGETALVRADDEMSASVLMETTTSGATPGRVVNNEADGLLDELRAWFLLRAEAARWVYTSVLR